MKVLVAGIDDPVNQFTRGVERVGLEYVHIIGNSKWWDIPDVDAAIVVKGNCSHALISEVKDKFKKLGRPCWMAWCGFSEVKGEVEKMVEARILMPLSTVSENHQCYFMMGHFYKVGETVKYSDILTKMRKFYPSLHHGRITGFIEAATRDGALRTLDGRRDTFKFLGIPHNVFSDLSRKNCPVSNDWRIDVSNNGNTMNGELPNAPKRILIRPSTQPTIAAVAAEPAKQEPIVVPKTIPTVAKPEEETVRAHNVTKVTAYRIATELFGQVPDDHGVIRSGEKYLTEGFKKWAQFRAMADGYSPEEIVQLVDHSKDNSTYLKISPASISAILSKMANKHHDKLLRRFRKVINDNDRACQLAEALKLPSKTIIQWRTKSGPANMHNLAACVEKGEDLFMRAAPVAEAKNLPTAFGERLKHFAKLRGVSLYQIIKKTGIPSSTMYGWTGAGKIPGNVKDALKIAKVLNVTLHDLAFETGEVPTNPKMGYPASTNPNLGYTTQPKQEEPVEMTKSQKTEHDLESGEDLISDDAFIEQQASALVTRIRAAAKKKLGL